MKMPPMLGLDLFMLVYTLRESYPDIDTAVTFTTQLTRKLR